MQDDLHKASFLLEIAQLAEREGTNGQRKDAATPFSLGLESGLAEKYAKSVSYFRKRTADEKLVCLVKPDFRFEHRFLSGSGTKLFRVSSRARRRLYLPDFPSMRDSSSLWLGPPNSTSLPWRTTRSTMAAASLPSAKTVPHLPNSTLAVNITLPLSQLSDMTRHRGLAPSTSKGT